MLWRIEREGGQQETIGDRMLAISLTVSFTLTTPI